MRRHLLIPWLCALIVPITRSDSLAASCLYVANHGDDTVSVLDAATNAVAATVPVGTGPGALAVSPSGSAVYVANLQGESLSVIDTRTNTVAHTIELGGVPTGIAITPNGATVYVAMPDGAVAVINTTAGLTTLRLTGCRTDAISCDLAKAVAVDSNGTFAYVFGQDEFGKPSSPQKDSYITKIDTRTNQVVPFLIDFGPVGFVAGCAPPALARAGAVVAAGNTKVYATDPRQSLHPSVESFDAESGLPGQSVPVTGIPIGIAAVSGTAASGTAASNGGFVYVVTVSSTLPLPCHTTFGLTTINSATGAVTSAGAITGVATALAVTPDGARAYVTALPETGDAPGNVVVVDPVTAEVLSSIEVGHQPDGVAVGDVPGGCGCVGDCDGDGTVTISEILTMARIALGGAPVSACERGDANGDRRINVNEVLTAVNHALDGCGS